MRKFLDSPWLYFGLAIVLLVLAVASQFKLQTPSRPSAGSEEVRRLADRDDVNVLFLLVDTLRADHLSAYGYERRTSPVLEDLASVGVRFAHNESQSSWTKTSMASLWTGVNPATAGVLRYPDGIADSVTMPAEIFEKAGFRTAGIFRNEWVAANFGFGQGFGVYGRPAASQTPERFERRSPSTHPLQGTDLDATEAAIQFARTFRNERFFLYVHYMDAHQYLYSEDSARFGTRYVDAYDNAIYWTDRNIGHLLAALDEIGLLERTLVVIASDHGEAFGEHGHEGHARDLHREVVHVPLLFSFPFRFEKPVVVEPVVRNIDIWPTVLDLLGLPELPGAEGISLVPLIEAAAEGRQDESSAPEAAVAMLDQTWGLRNTEPKPLAAIREGDRRLILPVRKPETAQFYDLASDPGELRDLAPERSDAVASLRTELESQLARADGKGRTVEVPVDEINLVQLRALGYVVGEDEQPKGACPPGDDGEAGKPCAAEAQ